MKSTNTFIPLLILLLVFSSCGDEMKEMEKEEDKEQENYIPNTSWNEKVATKNRIFNQSYTKDLSGSAYDDEFYFAGENDSLETEIEIHDEPLVEGKTYLLKDATQNSFINAVSWFRRSSGTQRYDSVEGVMKLTKVNLEGVKGNEGDFAYVDGNYNGTVVYGLDTVMIEGTFKDIKLDVYFQ